MKYFTKEKKEELIKAEVEKVVFGSSIPIDVVDISHSVEGTKAIWATGYTKKVMAFVETRGSQGYTYRRGLKRFNVFTIVMNFDNDLDVSKLEVNIHYEDIKKYDEAMLDPQKVFL